MANLVLCCGMIRSGSTLQYHYAKALVEHFQKGLAIGYIEDWEILNAIPAAEQVEYLVVKNHDVRTAALAPLLNNEESVFIYCYRDIRDVIVSMMKKTNISFEESVANNLQYALDNFYAVTKLSNPLISRYEDIVADPAREVKRIAEKLSLTISNDLANAIAIEYSISKQRQRIASFDFEKDGVILNGHRYDPQSLLNENHINTGALAQWTDVLSCSQIQWIESHCAEWLRTTGYSTDNSFSSVSHTLTR